MAVELKIPEAGESITEVQIAEWMKAEGDYVEQDEPVVELETDKASMELPAPAAGVLARILKQAGDTVAVGAVIAEIDDTAEAPAPKKAARKTLEAAEGKSAGQVSAEGKPTPAALEKDSAADKPSHVMPAARRMLAEAGLSASDVKATGPGGRLLKEDVLRHLERDEQKPPERREAAETAPHARPAMGDGDRREEAVPMTMLRRRIAERLVDAQHTAAMLTTFNEIDMTAVIGLRKRRNDEFQQKYGIKLGFMSFFVKAAIDALKRVPQVNAEIRHQPGSDGKPQPHIVYHNYYDIGVAVGTEKGLVVPVIRNAERLSFAEIELAIADLAQRARERKITVEELQGGTFTISNGGIYGSMLSTPILNPPQSGILGLHAIQERPVARDGQVVIRPMMYVALTYDHRIIDGQEAVTFLKRLKECVEEPTRMLIEV